MKRVLFFVSPIILALITFFSVSFFLSQSTMGMGALQVTSIPLSNVYLNDKLIGKTPLCKCEGKDMLPTGDYTLKLVPLSGDNLSSFEERITITKSVLTVVDRTFGVGEESSGFVVNLTPLADKKTVGLFVATFPTEASVAVDGNDAGTSPLLVKNLTSSDHDITISKNGYTTKTVHVHTNAGYQLNAVVTLAIIPPDATSSAALQNAPLTPVATPKVTILQTPTGFLRVRADPSLTASETAQVKPGDSFDFVDEQDGWYEIKLSNGTNGWVSASYVEKK